MSTPAPTLQERVLNVLVAKGPIRATDLERFLPAGVDRIDIDTVLTRLMRDNKASLSLGQYDAVKAQPGRAVVTGYPSVSAPIKITVVEAPPSAADEAAASLSPDPPRWCEGHRAHHPTSSFQRSNLANAQGAYFKSCKAWHGIRTAQGKRKGDSLSSPQGESSIPTMDVAPEPTSEPVVTAPQGNAGESPASNTSTAPTTASLESAPDKESPVAADIATGPASLAEALHTVLHGPDVTPLPTSSQSFQDMLEAKRLALIVRIEEAEALVGRLKSQLVELDRAVAGLRVVMPEVFG